METYSQKNSLSQWFLQQVGVFLSEIRALIGSRILVMNKAGLSAPTINY
jgi:hypothetical protein